MHMEQMNPDEVCVCGHTQFDHEVFHVDVTEVEIGECEPMCECEEYKKREHFVFKTQAVVYWETDADGNVVKVTVVPASRSPHYISHGLSFVEVDGSVQRDPVTGQPIGTLVGVAIEDIVTGKQVNLYLDPQGRRFYASFTPQSS